VTTRRAVDNWYVPEFVLDPIVFHRRASTFSVVRQFSGKKPWHVYEGEGRFHSAHATAASAMKAADNLITGTSRSIEQYEAEIARICAKMESP
jgi:hypothetical protein